MKKLLPLLAAMFIIVNVQSQYIHKIKADSVLITNDSCNAELNLENSTKHIKGFLYNKGNGRTEFRKAVVLNDSTVVFGEDTLVIRGTGGSSNAWKLTGNAGTDTAINFIGTTDTQALVFRTNNQPVMMIEKYDGATWPKASVGIGTLSPHFNYKLHINAHDVQPHNDLVPFYTGSILGADAGPTRITQISAGVDFDRPYFTTVKANGTLTSPTAVTTLSRLGTFETWGYDGTNLVQSGALEFWVDGTPSTGSIPSTIRFSTGTATNMVLRSSGKLGLGTTAPVYQLHVIADSIFGVGSVSTQAFSATSGGFFNAICSTATPSSPGAADQRLGGLNVGVNTAGSTYRHAASIAGFSEGAWATNGTSLPTYLTFNTTASGSGTQAERMRITAAGTVGIGTTTPGSGFKLDVNGKAAIRTIDSTSTPNNLLYQDPSTGEIKKTAVSPYKKYVALLSQSGSGAPTATILENTLGGTITWARTVTGNYTGTLTGAFTSNKTWFSAAASDTGGNAYLARLVRTSANVVGLIVKDDTLNSIDGWTVISIEIRIYP